MILSDNREEGAACVQFEIYTMEKDQKASSISLEKIKGTMSTHDKLRNEPHDNLSDPWEY